MIVSGQLIESNGIKAIVSCEHSGQYVLKYITITFPQKDCGIILLGDLITDHYMYGAQINIQQQTKVLVNTYSYCMIK